MGLADTDEGGGVSRPLAKEKTNTAPEKSAKTKKTLDKHIGNAVKYA
ncbi:MAG: hypothetical protein LUI61_06645 [Firmicutes bacterium]|nr:hypothetical protein [Bacillota bacterium]